MNDDRIADTLRTTLAGRAETVTHGPGWDGAEELLDTTPTDSSRARWLAPLAAAAVVLAVVGAVFAVKGSSSDHASAGQRPIPAGMRAVDALGVEIFVPDDYTIDDTCRSGPTVIRPVPRSGSPCPAVQQADEVVEIAVPKSSDAVGSGCDRPIALDGEHACPEHAMSLGTPGQAGPASWSATWPRHDVTVSVANLDDALTVKILRSAHAVPIDRNGCSATNTDLYRALPRNIPDPADIHPNGLPLPTTGVDGMSVCWYINNRLAASAQLEGSAGQRMAKTVNALPAIWPLPQAQPALPSCDSVDQHDGVELITHTSAGVDIGAIAQLAACDGQRTVGTGSHGVLVEPELAAALAKATGIPFSDGYRARP